MIKWKLAILLFILMSISIKDTHGELGALRSLIQTNIVGLPVFHRKVMWRFDPDVSQKRRAQWEEIHGIKGERLIERLGLGVDGREGERLAWQRTRDEGHLGGLNYFSP